MKITYLKDHNLLKATSSCTREYISKCDFKDPSNDPIATEKERYAIETFLSISNVIGCVDQLHFSIDMLSGYRANTAPDKMNRHDYIVFGIENYFLRLTSVYDRCLRLANIVFEIGLPERQCNNDTIIKNSHISKTTVSKSLNKLDKFTGPFRFHRNKVAHKGSYTEESLSDLAPYFYLSDEDDSFSQYRFLFKKKEDDFISEKKTEFKKQVSELELLVDSYFNSLHNEFQKRLKAYV